MANIYHLNEWFRRHRGAPAPATSPNVLAGFVELAQMSTIDPAIRLAMRWNNCAVREFCSLCEPIETEVRPMFFLDGTHDCVCDACGRGTRRRCSGRWCGRALNGRSGQQWEQQREQQWEQQRRTAAGRAWKP